MPITMSDIEAAATAIEGEVLRTPALPSQALSDLTGADIVLKLENQQPTGSFKVRGALAKLLSLKDGERTGGVIAQSAGNHAQGVAYHAKRLGIPATIVMPTDTPFSKINRTERLGARVVIEGETLSQARECALAMARTDKLQFVHPYDDADIIAGQGTVGLELLGDFPDLDAIVVPIGGGGLIAGIAIAAKHLNPKIEIIGVEAELYPSMYEAVNGLAASSGGQTVADGIAVIAAGELTLEIVARMVDDIELVGDSAIEEAMHIYISEQRIVAEGAGAAPLAAVIQSPDRFRGRKVGLIVSGGNVDSRLLSSVLLRSLARDGRLARLRVETRDVPGSLAKIAAVIGANGGNIVEVYHQRLFYDIPVKATEIDVVMETRGGGEVAIIVAALEGAGFPTRLLSATSDGAGP